MLVPSEDHVRSFQPLASSHVNQDLKYPTSVDILSMLVKNAQNMLTTRLTYLGHVQINMEDKLPISDDRDIFGS